MIATKPDRYIEAIGRNPGEQYGKSHLYAVTSSPDSENQDLDYLPMCQYGWNRSDGESFSIFRGHRGSQGLCKICAKRAAEGLSGVEAKPGSHKTRWI